MTLSVQAETKRLLEETYYEYLVGPFSLFSPTEASRVVGAAYSACAGQQRPLLLSYVLAPQKWRSLTSLGWTVLETRTFHRKALIGKQDVEWNIGFAEDAELFARILHWAWHASMGETLLLAVADPACSDDIARRFRDDWGDADVNERLLLPDYDPIFARAYEGNYVRIDSFRMTGELVRSAFLPEA